MAPVWIWPRTRAFLGLPGVEVVEIVEIYRAYSYLLSVGGRQCALWRTRWSISALISRRQP